MRVPPSKTRVSATVDVESDTTGQVYFSEL